MDTRGGSKILCERRHQPSGGRQHKFFAKFSEKLHERPLVCQWIQILSSFTTFRLRIKSFWNWRTICEYAASRWTLERIQTKLHVAWRLIGRSIYIINVFFLLIAELSFWFLRVTGIKGMTNLIATDRRQSLVMAVLFCKLIIVQVKLSARIWLLNRWMMVDLVWMHIHIIGCLFISVGFTTSCRCPVDSSALLFVISGRVTSETVTVIKTWGVTLRITLVLAITCHSWLQNQTIWKYNGWY